jgi:hypothetical protein
MGEVGRIKTCIKGLGRSEVFVIHSDFSRLSRNSEESVNLNQLSCKGIEGIGIVHQLVRNFPGGEDSEESI